MLIDQTKLPAAEDDILNELPRRFELSHLSIDYLQPLFSAYSSMPGSLSRLGRAVSDRLLDFTVVQAIRQTEFYAELYKGLNTDEPIWREQLSSLPVVERNDVEQAGDAIHSRLANYAFSSYTSGTTSSKPLMIDRSAQEQRYLAQFHMRMNQSQKIEPGEMPLVLRLATLYHGRQLQTPVQAYTFPVSLSSSEGYLQAAMLLQRSFKIDGAERRISVMAGGLVALQFLTVYLASRGLAHLAEQIIRIQSTSHYVTDYARRWLSNFWDCRIDDAYSLTELNVSATHCSMCGLYHFNQFGIAEAVEWGTNRPLLEGRGKLLLTGLYPFTQMMPLIRYSPEDLVEVKQVECAAGTTGFRFLGRSKSGLNLSRELGAGSFVSGAEVYEILDPVTDVNRPVAIGKMPQSVLGVGGMPIFKLSRDENEDPRLSVELRYAPELFPERVAELKQLLRAGLMKIYPPLRELLEKEMFTINFHGPGSFEGDAKFRP